MKKRKLKNLLSYFSVIVFVLGNKFLLQFQKFENKDEDLWAKLGMHELAEVDKEIMACFVRTCYVKDLIDLRIKIRKWKEFEG